jgi:hypothetical protein
VTELTRSFAKAGLMDKKLEHGDGAVMHSAARCASAAKIAVGGGKVAARPPSPNGRSTCVDISRVNKANRTPLL